MKLKVIAFNHLTLYFIGLIFIGLLLWQIDLVVPLVVNATPSQINTYSDCPPQSETIQVWLDENNSPTGLELVRTIPFDSGTQIYTEYFPEDNSWREVEYDNYLRGVLAGEVGIAGYYDDDLLKVMAILARTKAYHLCGVWPHLPLGTHGIWGQVTQEYRPTKISTFTIAEQARYQQAVDFSNAPYITYNDDTFDVQYRDRGDEWTSDVGLPHKRIYDPPGQYFSDPPDPPLPWTGLMQENANIWAEGRGPDNALFPPWDYRRILAHYYTNVEFEGLTYTPPHTYRFNILEFGNMDDRNDGNPCDSNTLTTLPFPSSTVSSTKPFLA
jgi:hypothetical protein